mmetsp:Transcript_24907/g.83063  ORF Transcript_24907/g.83063 Transcript_24907/m.83063 type:complete len:235 (-) Transcript_24907:567-1271(-)
MHRAPSRILGRRGWSLCHKLEGESDRVVRQRAAGLGQPPEALGQRLPKRPGAQETQRSDRRCGDSVFAVQISADAARRSAVSDSELLGCLGDDGDTAREPLARHDAALRRPQARILGEPRNDPSGEQGALADTAWVLPTRDAVDARRVGLVELFDLLREHQSRPDGQAIDTLWTELYLQVPHEAVASGLAHAVGRGEEIRHRAKGGGGAQKRAPSAACHRLLMRSCQQQGSSIV